MMKVSWTSCEKPEVTPRQLGITGRPQRRAHSRGFRIRTRKRRGANRNCEVATQAGSGIGCSRPGPALVDGLIEKNVDGRDEIELVHVLAADAWGQGYATEAASALRDYAFNHLRLRRLIALIDPENHASSRVAEKVGIQFEGETRRPGGRIMRVYSMQAAPAGGVRKSADQT
jgi:RimJ/RimL family protein N-acetyltransferase